MGMTINRISSILDMEKIDIPVKKLGKLFTIARILKGISQVELAKKIGVDRQDISDWETGKRELKALALIKIICELDIDKDSLRKIIIETKSKKNKKSSLPMVGGGTSENKYTEVDEEEILSDEEK